MSTTRSAFGGKVVSATMRIPANPVLTVASGCPAGTATLAVSVIAEVRRAMAAALEAGGAATSASGPPAPSTVTASTSSGAVHRSRTWTASRARLARVLRNESIAPACACIEQEVIERAPPGVVALGPVPPPEQRLLRHVVGVSLFRTRRATLRMRLAMPGEGLGEGVISLPLAMA